MIRTATALLLLCLCVSAAADAPERTVSGSTITSARDPALRIGLPGTAQYLGADRWVLYDMADCELHLLVDADAHKAVQHRYWVQFEQYLPTRPEHYTYDSPRHVSIGGLDFYVDTYTEVTGKPMKHGSDDVHLMQLLQGKGYTLPAAGLASVRLVHLTDETGARS